MTLDKDQSSPQTTVLVVTDDNKDVDSLTRLLVSHGMIVLRAYNGPECLEIVRTHTVDVLVLDVMTPGMDGCAVGAELTQIARALPIIFVSEEDMDTRMARAMARARAVGMKTIAVSLRGDTSVRISDYAGILARIQTQLAVRRWEQEADRASAAIEPTKPPTTE